MFNDTKTNDWQQMMRARLGIDKTKTWADWVEEEEEEAKLTKTIEEQFKPPLLLGMRLRGGAAECGKESGEAGREPNCVASESANGQESDGVGSLTEGGLPRHVSAHGQEGSDGGALTEGGSPCHVSAHDQEGQEGGGGGALTEGGLTIELATSEPADRQRQDISDAERREQWRAARDERERAAHAERQRQQPPEMLIDFESFRKLERREEDALGLAAYYSDCVKDAEEICPEWLADLRREFDGETRITADNQDGFSEAPSLRNYRNKAKRTRDSLPARWYRMMTGEEWDGEAHSYSKARKKYRRWEEDYQQRERERQQRKKRDYSKKKRPADDNARRQARRIAQREREKATLAASASAHGQEGGGGGSPTEGGLPLHASAHGQDGSGGGSPTESGQQLLPGESSRLDEMT